MSNYQKIIVIILLTTPQVLLPGSKSMAHNKAIHHKALVVEAAKALGSFALGIFAGIKVLNMNNKRTIQNIEQAQQNKIERLIAIALAPTTHPTEAALVAEHANREVEIRNTVIRGRSYAQIEADALPVPSHTAVAAILISTYTSVATYLLATLSLWYIR